MGEFLHLDGQLLDCGAKGVQFFKLVVLILVGVGSEPGKVVTSAGVRRRAVEVLTWWPCASRSGWASFFARLTVMAVTPKSWPRRPMVASLRTWRAVARIRPMGVDLAVALVPGATERS
ncbi:hypothetical protein DMB38_25670 [Streptomyces sp. WAC 06738]|nr:hypothetical protein DMB38_25670 [Streptomyces sp. WAC 06738]